MIRAEKEIDDLAVKVQTIVPMGQKKKLRKKGMHSQIICCFHSQIYQNSIITRSSRCAYHITCTFEKG